MKSCIITVMKNEHQYLDEWIKYHLDLGVDHIFIFEDIDSDTHKEITSKYGDDVSLNSVFTIFDGIKTHDEVIDMKKNERYYQNRYFLYGMKYIQNNYPNAYDWCFAIDNDEFITLENEDDDLATVVSKYNDFDAFMLQWKCYGANGHIYTPNYEGKGLIGTYKEEAKGKLNNSDVGLTKTCYNLNTFKDEFFWNVHQPSDKCKWCKSDFTSFRLRPIYDNIYLRHYVTKSWEEYVKKIKIRGDILSGNRTYNDFFDVNLELVERKQELLDIAEKIIK